MGDGGSLNELESGMVGKSTGSSVISGLEFLDVFAIGEIELF
jgi:hypothetical protein